MTAKKIVRLLFGEVLVIVCIAVNGQAAESRRPSTPVTVENTPDKPVPVISAEPTRQPSQIQLPGTPFKNAIVTQSFNVPSDKRMVIELITVQGSCTTTIQVQNFWVSTGVTNPLDSNQVVHRLKLPETFHPLGDPSFVFFQSDYPLRLYADPGSKVVFFMSVGSTDPIGSSSVEMSVSGYLVPLDSPTLAP
jgi:hypothetical protein